MPRPTLALLAAGILGAAAYGAHPDPAESAARDATVSISGFAFRPGAVRILARESVTWRVGNDPEQHTVTPRRTGAFRDSGALFPGQTYQVTFPRAGTFAYYCRFHPFMEGSVIVGTSGRSPPGPSPSRPAEPTLERQPTTSTPTPPQATPGRTAGTPPTANATAPTETNPPGPGASAASPAALVLVGAALLLAGGGVLLAVRRRRG